jgi:hypothetical protein
LLQRLEITNYRSIAHADVPLRPFTILVGANGSGKSNLLKLLGDLSARRPLTKHLARTGTQARILMTSTAGSFTFIDNHGATAPEVQRVRVFTIDPSLVGSHEGLKPAPEVQPNGAGAIQVLDSLKTGDREDLFNLVEARLPSGGRWRRRSCCRARPPGAGMWRPARRSCRRSGLSRP